jgi:hypothetical protein
MDWNSIDGVEDLLLAEPSFIQVLLSKFALYKTASECVLTIEFDQRERTITHRITKERIRNSIPDFRSRVERYQTLFDSILLQRTIGNIEYKDPGFCFRYASGGVLPVLLMGEKEYYCLFFRDVFPIGWNIANGGCDSVTELLDPALTIERELREELIILALLGNRDYVYRSADGRTIDRPEFEIARELWNSYFKRMDFRGLKRSDIEVDWIDGPDQLSTTLLAEDNLPLIANPTTRCFVNITALDFSIEVDKVARIPVEPNALLLDGEISNYKLLGRPIGLFEVHQTEQKLLAGETEFYPASVYFFGTSRPGHRENLLDLVFSRHIPRLIKEGIRDEEHLANLKQYDEIFTMCPITNRMIRRYATHKTDLILADTTKPSVFVSYSSKETDLVQRIYTDLEKEGVACFMAPDCLKGGENILRAIFDAIGGADKFLLVSSVSTLASKWVATEFEEAVRLESEQKRDILLPINTDDAVYESDCAIAKLIRSRQMVDFRNWRDVHSYRASLEKLRDALST